jgi:hypothetical protein
MAPRGRRTCRAAARIASISRAVIEAARQRPEIARVSTTWLPSVPQLYVDQEKLLIVLFMEKATTARNFTPNAAVSHAPEATASSVEIARTIVEVDHVDSTIHF